MSDDVGREQEEPTTPEVASPPVRPGVPWGLALFLILASTVHEAAAVSEAEKTFLSMYFTDEELVVVSATRSLKSITRVAENVEVVTKEDIELMNAHTLADVLNGIAYRADRQTFLLTGKYWPFIYETRFVER